MFFTMTMLLVCCVKIAPLIRRSRSARLPDVRNASASATRSGCAREPLAIGILAERHQHLAHEIGEARDIDCASWRGRFRRRAAAGHQAMCTAAAPSGRRAASTLRAALTARSNSETGSSKSATGPVTNACTSSSGARTNVCVPDLLANT